MNKNAKRFAPAAVFVILLLLSSCMTVPVTVTSSTTPVYGKKISENLGRVQGSHKAYSVFCLWMVKRPDIDRAIEDALKEKGGDALINVTCYEKNYYFLFVGMHKVIVEGDAVKFTTAEQEDEKKPVKKGRRGR